MSKAKTEDESVTMFHMNKNMSYILIKAPDAKQVFPGKILKMWHVLSYCKQQQQKKLIRDTYYE